MTVPRVEVAIIGAGAAGLMAAIAAGRALGRHRLGGHAVVALDGAARLGAKILVAGGGRCNVTHHAVDESAFAGSSRPAIRNVLGRFPVERTVDFFRQLGVTLKQEQTGKLFPTTDDARTVLDALLRAAELGGARLVHPWRVAEIRRHEGLFIISRGAALGAGISTRTAGPASAEADAMNQAEGNLASGASSAGWLVGAAQGGESQESDLAGQAVIAARRIILATGGMALPKTGSDGQGYAIARAFGHECTARIFPALVPLLLPKDHPLLAITGLAATATLELRAPSGQGRASGQGHAPKQAAGAIPAPAGRVLASFTNATLCTHFGLSGPAVLDISRYWLDAAAAAALGDRPPPALTINWLPGRTPEGLDGALVEQARTSPSWSCERAIAERASPALPDRLARTIVQIAGLEPGTPLHALTRPQRRALAESACRMPLPICGDRGYVHAEVTAGGVPLSQINLATMESRRCPGLYLCGEICDVDGRIGGFNFQWAWASGHVAGTAAAEHAIGEGAEMKSD